MGATKTDLLLPRQSSESLCLSELVEALIPTLKVTHSETPDPQRPDSRMKSFKARSEKETGCIHKQVRIKEDLYKCLAG